MDVLNWRYVKHGVCHFCSDEDAGLRTPVFKEALHVVIPPLFCLACRIRFEEKLHENPDKSPQNILALMTVR